jgi:DNA polymerase I-like protein with 3'-5' exonuclease and polymerase domains
VGYSFAIEDGPSFYVPMRHAGGDNVSDPQQGLQYLRDQAAAFEGDICGANLGYDLDFLEEAGIKFPKVKRFRDCLIAEPLLDELQDSYSLENVAKRRGLPGKDETLLREAATAWHLDPKGDLWQFPARFVGPYGEQDARLPLTLLRRQERDIEEQELEEVYTLESKLLPVLVRMRRRGVRVDFKRLQEIEDWSVQVETDCLQQVYELTRVRVAVGDVWKADAMAKPLLAAGIKVSSSKDKKGNDKYSVDKAVLSINHPVAKLLGRARRFNKLRTTFAKSVREHAIGDRIHCTFNQLRRASDSDNDESESGARFGRVSCCDPNLQQQPARDDPEDEKDGMAFSKKWRSIYVPDGDGMFASPDLSQQEPRWLVHFAEASGCKGASVAGDKYRSDPNTDNHTMMSRLIYGLSDTEFPTKLQRTYAKTIFLGLCYGMGSAKLARKLGLPTQWVALKSGKMCEVAGPEAQSILDQFDRQVPFIRKLAKLCTGVAEKRGYILTVSGRRCRFPMKKDGTKYDWGHKALNRLIQGSSGDQVKMIMVEADRQGFGIQLQVHDELCQTVYSTEEAESLADIMRNTVKARVPFKVDCEVGPSWGEVR